MTETDQMAPEASPGEVTKKSGVRRVNNGPMYIIGGVLIAFVIIMIIVAADRSAQQNAGGETQKERARNASMFAREITGDNIEGMIQAATPPTVPTIPDPTKQEPVLIARPTDLDTPPQPPHNNSVLAQPQRDEEAVRIRMAKLQMLQQAIKAKTGVQIVAPRSVGSSPGSRATTNGTPRTREEMIARLAQVRQEIAASQSDDPTAAYKARLAQIKGVTGNSETGGSGIGGSAPTLLQASSVSNNNAKDGTNRWQLNAKIEAPRSPYELRAGFVIPGTLISGINSELPGQIMSQVSQNVYDTATGKYLLIPLGSRLVGSYSSEVAYGQSRVLVAWQRIVFPDGKALDIGSMPGADEAGYSGAHDQVNNHYWRLFSAAFFMSAVTAGISYTQDKNNSGSINGNPTAGSEMSQALGQQLGQVTAQLISKNMNIAPTLEIRPGYRFNIIVTKDITFSKPYRAFDY